MKIINNPKFEEMNPEENKDQTNEPDLSFNERIFFFNSIEEMNEHDYRSRAALTPSEALSQVTYLRLLRYPELNLNDNPWGNEIYFE